MQDKRVKEKKRLSGKGRIALIVTISLLVGLFLSFAVKNISSYEEQTSEVAIFKSPLVWSIDPGGDYLLPRLGEVIHELTDAIPTEGQIKTITANWEFKGKVTLEVSADNGLNYTTVVNGVPLSLDARSGNKLKWKATIGPDSELTEIRIAYTDTSGVIGTFGEPQLSGFKFRKPVHINSSSGEELFNYQMKIRVGEYSPQSTVHSPQIMAKTEADFKDIRFTGADGETLLPYYLEDITGERPNRVANFWVKVPQIPEEGVNIYVYYGNPEAEVLSNGSWVFDFFDDFEEEELDNEKWEIQTGLGGSYKLLNSQLKLDAAKVISKDYQMEDGIIEYRAKAEAGYEIRAIIGEEKGKPDLTQLAYSSTYPDAEHSIAIGNIVKANAAKPILPAVFYDYRVIAKGEEITFERYAIRDTQYAIRDAEVSFQDTGGLDKGYIGLEVGGRGDGDSVAYYDWLRVRKFANPEPSIGGSGDEEEVELAEFLDTTVADNGDVIIVHSPQSTVHSGQYTTSGITTACNISAITPTIKVISDKSQVISLDISADGGLTWRAGCKSGGTYTAPDDFSVGRQLLLRANLSRIQDQGSSIEDLGSSIEEIKLDYSVAPIVTSANVYCSGATGEGGLYQLGDTMVVEWDNSSRGDNNPDIVSAVCNFKTFGGEARAKMWDDGPEGGHRDKKAGDDVYTVRYELPGGIDTTANIFVTASNSCGLTTRDGHMLSVNTYPKEEVESKLRRLASLARGREERVEREKKIEKRNLKKRYKIKFGEDEAEIGDFRTEDFRPHVKLKRWGKECYLSVELPDSKIKQENQSVELAASKIEWASPELNTRFYKKPPEEITKEVTREVIKRHRLFRWIKKRVEEKVVRKFIKNENGGLEFEIILKERPASNVITLPIDAEGLKFYYEGPLTQEEIDMGIVRPDEVVGSYAVYHTSKKDGKYATGKAFHIYRPKIIDAQGNETWGEIRIDPGSKILEISIDQAWLNKAAYPVTIDPEFGYTSIGSSSLPIGNVIRGSVFMAEPMRPSLIAAYLENVDSSAPHTAKYAIYSANDSTLVAHTEEVTIPASGKGWYEGLYTSSPNLLAEEYALVARGNDENILIYFDQGTPNQGVSQTINYTEAWPEVAEFAYDDNIYSIYDDDTTPPSFTSVAVSDPDEYYKVGDTISFDVNLGEQGLTVTADLSVLDTALLATFELTDDLDDTYSGTTSALASGTMIEWVDIAVTLTATDTASNQTQDSSLTLTIDNTNPGEVSSLTSTSHSTSTWSNDNTVDISWAAATDATSGLDGYSYVWDTTSDTLPDTTKDIESVTSNTSDTLSDGNSHYFHIRSVDNAGNRDATAAHLGPFYIDTTVPATANITVPMSLGYSTMPSLFQGEVADNSGGAGAGANTAIFYLCKVSGTTSYYWDGTNWGATSAEWLATTHSATTSNNSSLWSNNVTLPPWTKGETYFVKLKAVDKAGNELFSAETPFYYSGPPGLTKAQEEKVDAIRAKTDTIAWTDVTSIKAETDKIPAIKAETDKITSIKSETVEILTDTGTTLPSAISAVKSETAEILADTGTTLPSVTTSAKEEMVAGIESRIMNQQSYVREDDTLTIRYKTDSGLSPLISVYDADNTPRISEQTMTESVSGSGIYEYDVKFKWGRGEHTIVCKEESKGTVDGINIQVISTDLEQISAAATTTMGKLAGINTDQIEMFTTSVAEINTVIARTIASMDELAGLSTKIEELAKKTTAAIYSELNIGAEKLKEINESQGIKIEKMYELSEEQATDVDYIRNKTLEIKALVELSQEILSRTDDKPIVKSWMENGK